MTEDGESRCSVLFRIQKGGDLYSIPVQYIIWAESLEGKAAPCPRSPEYIVGTYLSHGKNISVIDLGCLLGLERNTGSDSLKRSLLIINHTEVGFLVEAVVGVELLHSPQSSGTMSNPFVQSVYLRDGRDELVLELDIPHLLSIC